MDECNKTLGRAHLDFDLGRDGGEGIGRAAGGGGGGSGEQHHGVWEQGLTLVPISGQLELFCPPYNPT